MKPSEVHKTIKRVMIGDGDSIIIDLERSHGVYLVDAVTGREYLDFFSYFASQPIGHNHPKMHEPEFLKELSLVALHKPSLSDFYTTQMAKFVATFERVAMPESMKHLFLISGGALAVENALKTAFDWKFRRNLAAFQTYAGKKWDYSLEGRGTQIIHFEEAFHGRSGYTLSLTNTAVPQKHRHFPKFKWPRVINPKLHFPVTEEVLAEVKRAEEIAIAQIEAAVRRYPGDIAALIIEPIQGEGGDNHFRMEFLRELRRLADEHEFLFIVDEVQTGMGLTGKMWAIEHSGVLPDIIAFGKKSQVCGIIAGPRIDEVEDHVFVESSRLNSTWGGNLTDMVRARRYLAIIEEEQLVENAARMGKRLLEGLQTIAAASDLISNARGRGLMCAFDAPDGETRTALHETLKKNGLLTLTCGGRSIRFRPFLDVKGEQIDEALNILEDTANEMRR
ncbi:MAG: L-lysine 6-transaminase [Anaerolineae bacterium]